METEKGSKMSPSEALFHVVSSHYMLDSMRRWPKPGQLVERMGPEIREALSRLTSEEAQGMSLELLGGVEGPREREARERAQYEPFFQAQMEQRRKEIRLRLMFEAKLRRQSSS
jgi:hypothetical protein